MSAPVVVWVAEIGDRNAESGVWYHATSTNTEINALGPQQLMLMLCGRVVVIGELREDEPEDYCKPCKAAFDAL